MLRYFHSCTSFLYTHSQIIGLIQAINKNSYSTRIFLYMLQLYVINALQYEAFSFLENLSRVLNKS
jgi:hypothetical protein